MQRQEFNPLAMIFTASLISIAALFTLFEVRSVEGRSMEPLLPPGTQVVISRLSYGLRLPFSYRYVLLWGSIHPGDIVVYQNPVDGTIVVKECIGTEGDPIKITDHSIIINGKTIAADSRTLSEFRNHPMVPDGNILAMGINPDRSVDSRHYGFIPRNSVTGKVLIPVDRRFTTQWQVR